jgi:inner membrane protein
MPTALTHVAAGAGLGALLAPPAAPAGYYILCAALALLPDADVVTFRLGIPYASWCGHRGFSHSFALAFLAACAAGGLAADWLGLSWLALLGPFFAVIATHSLLDALTNGGCGVALFAPFDSRRYFFPWRPIQVSPIGWGVFSRWGWRALRSELVWVWLPLGAAVCLTLVARTHSNSHPD